MLVITDKAVVRPDLQQILPRPRLFDVLTISSKWPLRPDFSNPPPVQHIRNDALSPPDSHARMVQHRSLGSRLVLFLQHDPLAPQLVVHVRDVVHIRNGIALEVELVEDVRGQVPQVRFVRARLGESVDRVRRFAIVVVHVRDLSEGRSGFRLVRGCERKVDISDVWLQQIRRCRIDGVCRLTPPDMRLDPSIFIVLDDLARPGLAIRTRRLFRLYKSSTSIRKEKKPGISITSYDDAPDEPSYTHIVQEVQQPLSIFLRIPVFHRRSSSKTRYYGFPERLSDFFVFCDS